MIVSFSTYEFLIQSSLLVILITIALTTNASHDGTFETETKRDSDAVIESSRKNCRVSGKVEFGKET